LEGVAGFSSHDGQYLLANHYKCQTQHRQDTSHGLFRHRMLQRGEKDIEGLKDASIVV
jgi:hypothetical protein